ncbi:MAG: hypothetical protein ACOVS5_09015 [Oligoflexus sp.]|jgi:hypothetical protein
MKHYASGLLVTLLLSLPAYAAGTDDLSKARAQVSFIYKRLAGIPPLATDLESFATKLAGAADKDAVLLEVADAAVNTDSFYSKTVLDFAQPESNEERELNDAAGTLSDLTATIIGHVRDGKDYRTILYGDSLYIPNGQTYSPDNNTIYDTFYNQVKAGTAQLAAGLTEVPQAATTGLGQSAGIHTLRGFGSVYYDAGTNRAPLRFTYLNYTCKDMEDFSDVTRSDVFVRRDVERAPGGDPAKFKTECVGCHAGMDPQANAFAYVNFVAGQQAGTGRIQFATAPVAKVNQNNDVFPTGAIVTDDSWMNLWLEGTNASAGWDASKKSGKGIKSWAEMIASTKMFPDCMAKRAYKVVCLRDASSSRDKAAVSQLSTEFVNSGYNMKELFKAAAAECASKIGM